MTGRPRGDWVARLHLPTLAVSAAVLAVWSLASWRYGAYVLPSPLAVARGFVDILQTGEVWHHTAASLARSSALPRVPASPAERIRASEAATTSERGSASHSCRS